ncbi:hypothetical protein E3N88_04412 [Mikania micrantha]|uniref:Uncharacterized protein n=1 Tax=Mikania micrantha TaxID=192012 RepID=A0A5N6PUF6_9ASTR|nr:hypothetical protein E3N88_04412 [Mikania micrantha]
MPREGSSRMHCTLIDKKFTPKEYQNIRSTQELRTHRCYHKKRERRMVERERDQERETPPPPCRFISGEPRRCHPPISTPSFSSHREDSIGGVCFAIRRQQLWQDSGLLLRRSTSGLLLRRTRSIFNMWALKICFTNKMRGVGAGSGSRVT